MPIVVSCECGRTLRAKDEAAGRKVRCPACGAIVAVAAPDEYEDVSNDTFSPPVTAPRRKARGPERASTAASDDAVSRPLSKTDDTPEPPPPTSRPPRRKRRTRRRESEGRGISIGIASIITGVAMMLGASIWFITGLAFGYIFFYPPILFLLGIAAVVRGFMGRE
jgi:hypothetical protein